MTRTVNESGLELIKFYEKLALAAYFCPAGVPTIGWGHTRTVTKTDVQAGKKITRRVAQALFESDVADAAEAVERALNGAPCTDNQFAALVSFTFNCGAQALNRSSVLRLHLQGRYDAAAQAFKLWNKARVKGQLVALRGLTARRAREAALYLEPGRDDAEPPEPMVQAVEAEKPLTASTTMGASFATVLAGATSVVAQISDDIAKVRDGLGLNSETFALAAAAVAVATGCYLMWKRWQGRQEGRV